VFLVMMGRSATSQGYSDGQRERNYKLKSVSKDSSSRAKKTPKEVYPTDTVDLVAQESVERILPFNRIRKTFDVNIDRRDRREGERPPGSEAESMYRFGDVSTM